MILVTAPLMQICKLNLLKLACSAALAIVVSPTSGHAQKAEAPVYWGQMDAIDLSTVGLAGTGGDDTDVIQHAINLSSAMGKPLQIPASAVAYNIGPLTIPSNTTIAFDAGVVMQARSGLGSTQKLINIVGVSNVQIKGSQTVFQMRKSEYQSGEYRHCLHIEGSSAISVSSISCNSSGGDGVYIGAGSSGYSSDISIADSSFTDNRRQGMSIISGVNITITRCSFNATQGTAPAAGIDIEPNSPNDRLQNILIQDSTTSGNAGNGVAIDTRNLNASSSPVSIQIQRHSSSKNRGSGYYMTNENSGSNGATGSITISNSSSSFDSQYGAVASFYNASGPALVFQNLNVAEPNQSKTTYDNSAVAVKRGGGGQGLLGNVYFFNTSISSTTGTLDTYFSFWDYSYIGFTKVQMLNPVSLVGAKRQTGILQGRSVLSVNIP